MLYPPVADLLRDVQSRYLLVNVVAQRARQIAAEAEEFQESLQFIQKCGFSDMHIFPYSRRPGTPADKMSGQHPNAVKEQRSREAIAVAEKMSQEYRKRLIGSTLQVLFEEPEGEYFTGHAPNYVKVYVTGEKLHNQFRTVKVTDIYCDGVLGTIL